MTDNLPPPYTPPLIVIVIILPHRYSYFIKPVKNASVLCEDQLPVSRAFDDRTFLLKFFLLLTVIQVPKSLHIILGNTSFGTSSVSPNNFRDVAGLFLARKKCLNYCRLLCYYRSVSGHYKPCSDFVVVLE